MCLHVCFYINVDAHHDGYNIVYCIPYYIYYMVYERKDVFTPNDSFLFQFSVSVSNT